MVFKFLQEIPLGLKSLVFQAVYGFVLFALVSYFGFSWPAFLFGFFFSHIYMLLFFYSASLLFHRKKRNKGIILLFVKWFFLFIVLLFVSRFLDGSSFLIGLSAFLSLLLCYVLASLKKLSK